MLNNKYYRNQTNKQLSTGVHKKAFLSEIWYDISGARRRQIERLRAKSKELDRRVKAQLEEEAKKNSVQPSLKATTSGNESNKDKTDSGDRGILSSDTLKDLLPLLALGGGGGLGAWGLYDLFSGKKSKTSGITKVLLGLLLAGAALYPMMTGKSLLDLLPGNNGNNKDEPSKQNKPTNK